MLFHIGPHVGNDLLGLDGECPGQHTAAAEHDSATEQTLSQGIEHLVLHAHSAGAFTHDGHFFRVAAKAFDVPLNPLQCAKLILHAVIAFVAVADGAAECIQAVVDSYHHDAPLAVGDAAKAGSAAVAGLVRAAVDVHKHRGIFSILGCPDIQTQAILFIADHMLFHRFIPVKNSGGGGSLFVVVPLGTGNALHSGIVNTLPGSDRDRGLKPICMGIENALKNIVILFADAYDLAAGASSVYVLHHAHLTF